MKKVLIAILAACALAVGGQSGNDLFQKALVLERTEGNLQEAIKLYQQIVGKFGADRKLAAQALLQLGQCYEKLGLAGARRAYDRLVREFEDQTEQVQAARSRLISLGETRKRASASAMTARRVWLNPGIDFEGEISPDGKYLSFMDNDTGDLAIYDLESGTRRRLTGKGSWKESDAYAYCSRWAPDGKQIAYEWYDGRGWDLRLLNIDTAKSRILYKSRQWEVATPCDWSSDGKYILAFESQQYQTSDGNLLLISAEDGNARVLKSLHRSFHESPRLSPDGKYVALDLPQHDSGVEHDIVLFAVNGGREAALVSHPANDWVLDWSPDGNWLLFASDRSGTLGVWAIQVVDGMAKGDPQLVKAGLADIVPMGLTRDGTLCYGQSSRNETVYLARLDPDTGKVTGSLEDVTQRYEGLCGSPAWSPDGKDLAFACSRGPIVGWRGRNLLRIRSLETGVEREFSTPFSSVHISGWLPGSRFMLITGVDDKARGVYGVDTNTWEMKLLLRDASAFLLQSVASPDGRGFFLVRREKELCRILFRDTDRGEEKELYRGPRIGFTISLSPDGSWLAVLNRTNPRILRIIPSGGGEPREILRFGLVGGWNIATAWTADGKYILFSKPLGPDGEKEKWDLWRVPAGGGEAQRLNLGMRCEPRVNPDGSRIAFTSSGRASIDEVWVLENLLRVLKVAR